MTTETATRERKQSPLVNARDYFSESCTYTIPALMQLGFSEKWFKAARAAKPPLPMPEINGNGTEVISGRVLMEFLEKNPRLLKG